MRKAGLEPASLAALAPKASVFAISPLPHLGEAGSEWRAGPFKCRRRAIWWQYRFRVACVRFFIRFQTVPRRTQMQILHPAYPTTDCIVCGAPGVRVLRMTLVDGWAAVDDRTYHGVSTGLDRSVKTDV